MIACDNQACTREWFHFECVGLTRSHVETGTAVITVNQKYDKFYIHQTSTMCHIIIIMIIVYIKIKLVQYKEINMLKLHMILIFYQCWLKSCESFL